MECFRDSWSESVRPIQWNVVRSEPGVFRGFHVHVRHSDYLLLAEGRMELGLRDIRHDSPTFGLTALIDVRAESPCAVLLPPGVAHGFAFLEKSIHIYAVSEYWDVDDELACHFRDPEIRIAWNLGAGPKLSERDAKAGSLGDMVQLFNEKRGAVRSVLTGAAR